MLKINNLHASADGRIILKGINLNVNPGEVHAIMGPNGSGKSTFSSVIAGSDDFDVTKGQMLFDDNDLSDMDPESRAHSGIFLSFQYPIEIPGITVTNFVKTAINSIRKAKGLGDMDSSDLLKKIREKSKLLDIDSKDALNSTTIVNTIAIRKGCKVLRVHDVKQAKEILKILDYLEEK